MYLFRPILFPSNQLPLDVGFDDAISLSSVSSRPSAAPPRTGPGGRPPLEKAVSAPNVYGSRGFDTDDQFNSLTATAASMSKLGGYNTPAFVPKLQLGLPQQGSNGSMSVDHSSAKRSGGTTGPSDRSYRSDGSGSNTPLNDDDDSNSGNKGEYSVHSGQFEPDIRNVFVGNIGRLPEDGVQQLVAYFAALGITVLKVDIKIVSFLLICELRPI